MVIKKVRKPLILKERIGFKDPALPMFVSEREEVFDIQALIKAEIAEAYAKPNEIVTATGDPVHVGIDSEYVQSVDADGNVVLCYSFFLIGKSFTLKGVIYPDSPAYKDRWTFEKFIGFVLHEALKQGVIDSWPRVTYCYGHFLRADVGSFKSFWRSKEKVDGLRGTVSSMRRGYGVQHEARKGGNVSVDPIKLRNQNGRIIQTFVSFVDTLLLTPGRKSLDAVGEMIGVGKLKIPPPHCISRMDKLLEDAQEFFERYAIRDAEIALKYGLSMHEFAHQTLGLKKLPLTIGSCAVALFRSLFDDTDYFNEVFGVDYVESQLWDQNKGKTQKRKRKVETVSRRFYGQFATDSFHGGRNECYVFGPTPEGLFYDYDLAGAYTTGMVDILPMDYENCYESKDPENFRGHVMGLAHVSFSFPEGTRFPCLPVRTEQYGLQFPLNGDSYCTAPEIEVALNMRAEIVINHGVIIPWKTEGSRVFQPFVTWVREERAKHETGSLADSLAKEIGCSLFGKTAQSLKNKSVFNTRTGGSVPVRESMVTNPYMAAHVTGFVRAVLAEVMDSIPTGRIVVSATTDGFLTDAVEADLKLSGPLASRYQALCDLVTDGEPMLVRKHQCRQVIAMKTRGQLTAIRAAREDEPKFEKRYVLAKTGVRPPKRSMGRSLSKGAQNEYMVDLFLKREPKQKHEMRHLISMREQWLTESDMVEIKRFIKLNLDFDFKRKPVEGSVRTLDVKDKKHVAFNTVPWGSEADMQQARALFDGWRKGSKDDAVKDGNVLKTEQDFESWMDWYDSHLATEGKSGINVTREGSIGLLRRSFLRALVKGKWGVAIGGTTNSAVAEWLTKNGYPTTVDDLKDASRKGTRLVANVVPVRAGPLKLLKVIMKRYPDFEYQATFVERVDPSLLVDE